MHARLEDKVKTFLNLAEGNTSEQIMDKNKNVYFKNVTFPRKN